VGVQGLCGGEGDKEREMNSKEMQELDAWLAENIVKWHKAMLWFAAEEKEWWFDEQNQREYSIAGWHPTRNIAQAFEVVEKMKDDEFIFDNFRRRIAGYFNYEFGELFRNLNDLSECICLAAKKAWEAK